MCLTKKVKLLTNSLKLLVGTSALLWETACLLFTSAAFRRPLLSSSRFNPIRYLYQLNPFGVVGWGLPHRIQSGVFTTLGRWIGDRSTAVLYLISYTIKRAIFVFFEISKTDLTISITFAIWGFFGAISGKTSFSKQSSVTLGILYTPTNTIGVENSGRCCSLSPGVI